MDAEEQERIGEENANFREMNESIQAVHRNLQIESLADCLCECGREDCWERVQLSDGEYELIRSNPRFFAVAPGHALVESGRLVESYKRFDLVEKVGAAATVAEERDPRRSSKD